MSKRLEKVKEELLSRGLELLSTDYQNLDTPLTVKCVNCGSTSFTTLRQTRKKFVCSGCKSDDRENSLRIAEVEEKSVPTKSGRRLLILDQSTTNCGWAVFENGKLLDFGVKSLGKNEIFVRIAEVNTWFESMLEKYQIDGVGLEDIQLQRDPIVYKKLSMLMGVLINTAIHKIEEVPYVISSSTWCNKCGIHARYRDERKRLSQNRVLTLFQKRVSQDAADAINLGTYVSQLDLGRK